MSYKKRFIVGEKERTFMAVDQYGQYYHDLGPHPRKTLLERIGRSHAEKMYVDRDSVPYHVGYIIAGLWLRIYEVRDTFGYIA